MKKILKFIFNYQSHYQGSRKHKVFTVFGFKFKFRVKLAKNLRDFVRNAKPCPLDNSIEPDRQKVYLSIAAIFKDEPDIIEWIEYHRIAGVERFYLYDNDSVNDYEKILKTYIDSGLVVYKKIHGRCMQVAAYKDAVYRYKHETEWMAIIDLDEYIVPVEQYDIKDFLKDYDEYPALVVNWVMFDSSGLDVRPSGKTVIESFMRVYKNYQEPINKTVKTILKPSKVRYVNGVHVSLYNNNELAVDENFNQFSSYTYFKTEKVSVNKIRINHYHCKSRKEYWAKVNKGFADRITPRPYKEESLNFPSTSYDYEILKYSKSLNDCLQSFYKTECEV